MKEDLNFINIEDNFNFLINEMQAIIINFMKNLVMSNPISLTRRRNQVWIILDDYCKHCQCVFAKISSSTGYEIFI
jgi:hypothetical protein